MEPNNQIKELIARFLINDLNDEEHALLVNWINASEENRHYFTDIKNTWQLTAVKLTEQVNEAEEWKLFSETLAARNARVVSMHEQDQAADDINEEVYSKQEGIVYRNWLRVAAAASVVLAICLGWFYFNKDGQRQIIVRETQNKNENITSIVQREVNTTGKEKSITLADGSMIVLFNNSEITYEKPFVRRHIKLAGKAFFKVAKDADRPFTVESDAIATTALGTEFTVTAFAHAKQLSVRLYNGKVVIKPIAPNNRIMQQATLLLPGQEFIYGPTTSLVRSFSTNSRETPAVAKEETPVNDNPSFPVNTKGSWHMYNNQALSEVLDHLAGAYGVRIVYEAKDVQKKYFVGQFKTTDSIETILKLITKANNLKYIREGNTYIIHQ
jgi:transmembrane sensor